MRIAAFDLGTNPGCCMLDTETGLARTTKPAKTFSQRSNIVRKKKVFEHAGARFARADEWVCGILDEELPDFVAYEKVMGHGQSGVQTAHLWGAWEALLLAACYRRGIEVVPVSVQAAKKAVSGRGVASKDTMIQQVLERYPYLPDTITHDEADAVAIALAAEKIIEAKK